MLTESHRLFSFIVIHSYGIDINFSIFWVRKLSFQDLRTCLACLTAVAQVVEVSYPLRP